MMAGYDINFLTIIIYELYERGFGGMTVLPFSYLIQLLFDDSGMPEVPSVDHKIEAMGVLQTSMIKDSINSILTQRSHIPLAMILTRPKGTSVPTEPSDK
ncbi:hypothetical protein FXO38_18196 [Capsicum annuum]|nr:hypothetical protein FXO38_18196 [Capsicum annuum]KAF3651122.1 hypothetical protein FXO37_18163 [Capsicum annuum]